MSCKGKTMKERYSSRIFLAAEMKLQMDAVCSSAPSPSFGCCQLMSCRAVARDAVELLPILLPIIPVPRDLCSTYSTGAFVPAGARAGELPISD